ncbi:MAG: hypothetical protein PHP83_03735, partial [Clostridia bacterium]|nr:hypothetical protein [Clostridia bacterium]
FSYDNETNVVTLSAELKNELGEIQIDTIAGTAFINEYGEIDAVMNIDGEGILLSEMRNAGMIENCGWFSSLIKKIVKVVIVATVIAAVAVTTAAIIVATAGAAAPALVAVGVGATTSATLGSSAAVALGGLFAMTIGIAAIQAGTAIAETIADGLEAVINKVNGNLLEIVYKGVRYAAKILTTAIIATLATNAYFIALANTKSGDMYYTPIAIPKNLAISVINFNSFVSIYTFLPSNARNIAQQAGNHKSPVFDTHHKPGYFDHFHRGDISHELAISHAFFGLPQFN